MRVVACYSIKGGVSKTATAVNLAYWAAAQGTGTLLVDLDPQGAASFHFRVRPAKKKWGQRFFEAYGGLIEQIRASDYPGLDILPAHLAFRHFDAALAQLKKRRKRLRRVLKGLKSDYDLVVLDCPPTLGPLAEAILVAADRVLVPVIPTTLSRRSYEQLLEFAERHELPRRKLRPFFAMVQRQKTLHRDTMTAMRAAHRRLADNVVPFARDIEYMGERCEPLLAYAPGRPAARALRALFEELAPELGVAADGR